MADSEKIFRLKLEVAEAQANANVKKLQKSLGQLDGRTKEYTLTLKKLNLERAKLSSLRAQTISANKQLSNSMDGVSSATGGATAATLELGRAISDAPYGIRGVANNLSQLASQFSFMTNQVDQTTGKVAGFSGALKQIGTAIKANLVLLLIQAGIAAADFFSNRMKKAEEDIHKVSESAAVAASNFKILLQAQEDNTLSVDEATKSVEKINKQYKDLNVKLDESGKLTDDSVAAIRRKITALEDLAKAQAIQSLVEEEYAKMAVKRDEAMVEAMERGAGKTKDEEGNVISALDEAQQILSKRTAELEGKNDVQRRSILKTFLTVRENRLANIAQGLNKLDKESKERIKRLIEEIPDISNLFGGANGGGGSSNRFFKQQLLNLEKFMLDTKRLIETGEEKNQIELLKIRQKYEEEDLLRRKESFIEKQKQRLADFKKSTDDADKIAEAQALYDESELRAESEHQAALTLLQTKHTIQRNNLTIELQEKFDEEMVNQRLKSIQASESMLKSLRAGSAAGSLGRPMSAVGAEDIESQNEAARQRMAAEQANFEDDLQTKIENLTNEGFSLLQIEQMVAGERHAFQMSQAEQEIELERNKIEAKKNINQEYVSWAQGLSGVFKSIAGENEALATAALVLEKGAAIAGVIITTQSANAQITANMLKEQGAFKAAAASTSLVMPAASAAFTKMAVTAGVLGKKRILKNNIGAGISIAKIAATTLQSRGGAGGGGGEGGGEGGGGRTFDFNLVGSTGQDQLAQAVGGQFSQGPVQAYVVSSQMTSQQQLDNIIESDATFGGDN